MLDTDGGDSAGISLDEADLPERLHLGRPQPRKQTLLPFQKSATVAIPLTNTGQEAADVTLRGEVVGGGCSLALSMDMEEDQAAPAEPPEARLVCALQPGETVMVTAAVSPLKRPRFGLRPQTHLCQIEAQAAAQPATTQTALSRVHVMPYLDPLLVISLAIILTGLLLLNLPSSHPETISGTQFVQIDPNTIQSEVIEIPSANTPVEEPAEVHLTYDAVFKDVAQEYGLDWRLLAELAYRESRLDPVAIGAANEMGLMQVAPTTWAVWSEKVGVSDPFDPHSNVTVSAAYLVFLQDYFDGLGYSGDWWMFAAYNWGPGNVQALLESGGDWTHIPVQTQEYVVTILHARDADAVKPAVFDPIQTDQLVLTD